MSEILHANILRGVKAAKTRKVASEYYAVGVLLEAFAQPSDTFDWRTINAAYLDKWTGSGLRWIKQRAWARAGQAAREFAGRTP